jgi:hypothetical protein
MNLTYKVFLICFFSITLGYSQNLIFEGLPIINKKESKKFFKSNEGLSKIIIKRNSDFILDLKKSFFLNNLLEKAVYRAKGPENYKSYNKRIGYMDFNKILEDLIIFLNNNSFNIKYQSPKYNDIIGFFENYETVLIEAENNKINLKLIPREHDLNYSLFIEISNKN